MNGACCMWTNGLDCASIMNPSESTTGERPHVLDGGDNTPERPRVLIVEDDAVQAVALGLTFEDAGYEVVGPVNTVERALDLIAACKPNAAAIDMRLHGATSAPVAQAMRDRGGRIVFVTAYKDDADGVIDTPVVRKPCDPQMLVSALSA